MALLAGSPALDHGDDADGIIVDQRGAQRGGAGLDAGAHFDIGAYEASSSYLVTSTADTANVGSLRAGIAWAEASTNPLVSSPTTNVVRFDATGAFATAQTLELTTVGDTTVGPSALAITGSVEIDGPVLADGGLTIAASPTVPEMRLFYVAPGGNLTLRDLTLSGGVAMQGFEGSSAEGAGGGAAGMGGAIYNRGALSIIDSTLSGNQAIGGAGGAGGGEGIGGGGGLVGPGGTPTGGAAGGGLAATGGAADHRQRADSPAAAGAAASTARSGSPGGWRRIRWRRRRRGGFIYTGIGTGGGSGGYGASAGGGGGTNGGGGGGGGGAGLGGALFNDGGTVSITNSTFALDAAIGGASGAALGTGLAGTAGRGIGGAIFSRGGTLVITAATIADNTAIAGGGLFVLGDGSVGGGSAVVSVNATIVAGSAGGAGDVGSATIGGGHLTLSGSSDLIETDPSTGGFPVATTDIVGQNPLLGPLADNGGATPTMALMSGSPALGAALTANMPLTDQRGAQRGPAGVGTDASPDIGAFEDSSSYLVTTTADAPTDGTLRAAVAWANQSTNPAVDASQPNVIVFDTAGAFATAAVIGFTRAADTTVGASALAITGDVEIDGPDLADGGLTLSPAASGSTIRVFYVAAGASLTLQNLTLTGGVARGFAGQLLRPAKAVGKVRPAWAARSTTAAHSASWIAP